MPRSTLLVRAAMASMAASFCSAATRVAWSPVDFAEAAVFVGFVDAFDEVVADVLQAGLLGRIRA
jgi:hypothetical protein